MESSRGFTPVTQIDGTTRPAAARALLHTEDARYGWYTLDPEYDAATPERDGAATEDEELGISADPIVVALYGLAVSFTETARGAVNQHVYPPQALEFETPSADMITPSAEIDASAASRTVLDAIHFANQPPQAPEYRHAA